MTEGAEEETKVGRKASRKKSDPMTEDTEEENSSPFTRGIGERFRVSLLGLEVEQMGGAQGRSSSSKGSRQNPRPSGRRFCAEK